MSEKLYDLLLRLYPSHFRDVYGEAALQLFRDRARDEKGFLPGLRLWIDLLADLAFSLPREYFHAQPPLIAATQPRTCGVPSFFVLEEESPRFGALLFGGVMTLAALSTFSILLGHGGSYNPLGVSAAPSFRYPNRASSSSSGGKTSWPAENSPGEFSAYARQPSGAHTFMPGNAKPRSLPSNQAMQSYRSDIPQSQLPQSLPHDATSVLVDSHDQDATLDLAARQRVIAGAIANLKEYYVYPEVAQRTADALLLHMTSGDDNAEMDGDAFAALLTRQMRDVNHDKHLILIYNRQKTPDPSSGPTPEDLARYRDDMRRNNCTFEKVRILPRNIGYLKFNAFPFPLICRPTMVAAMNSLDHADAIIFDLRDNRGGSPKMVALIATYLFDHPTHLNDIYYRSENTIQQSWTLPPVPGNRLVNKPAFVLTSASTFSGAEEFSYDLKMLKRATLVGETTAGSAHPASMHRIDDHFQISVPDARPINPISKTDWEGAGVEPDVKVNAADALQVAEKLAQATKKIAAGRKPSERRYFDARAKKIDPNPLREPGLTEQRWSSGGRGY